MSKKTLILLVCAVLLGAASVAAYQSRPSCCMKPAAQAATATGNRLRCSLTGRIVDRCCCVKREGRLHCTLADKDVASCCCTPADDQEKKGK